MSRTNPALRAATLTPPTPLPPGERGERKLSKSFKLAISFSCFGVTDPIPPNPPWQEGNWRR